MACGEEETTLLKQLSLEGYGDGLDVTLLRGIVRRPAISLSSLHYFDEEGALCRTRSPLQL
jgi:hypothetical protein